MKRVVFCLATVVVLWLGSADKSLAARRDELRVISFNIQFLGHFHDRRNEDLADMLAPYDLVIVQELVAPPYAGTFPDGTPFVPDEEARTFFEAMKARNFEYALSEEDTGTGPTNHLNGTATEWFVAFYKPRRVKPASDLPHGFLAEDRTNHPDFERVPYAFSFRAGNVDLVFISVHLQPNAGAANRARRARELGAIFSWISAQSSSEKDYVVLGDMNIQNCIELASVVPDHHASLNGDCQATTTSTHAPKPYDHVIYDTVNSAAEINTVRGLTVINLIEEMRLRWPAELGTFPGQPYNHDAFRTHYSDHHPILFVVQTRGLDDD